MRRISGGCGARIGWSSYCVCIHAHTHTRMHIYIGTAAAAMVKKEASSAGLPPKHTAILLHHTRNFPPPPPPPPPLPPTNAVVVLLALFLFRLFAGRLFFISPATATGHQQLLLAHRCWCGYLYTHRATTTVLKPHLHLSSLTLFCFGCSLEGRKPPPPQNVSLSLLGALSWKSFLQYFTCCFFLAHLAKYTLLAHLQQ